MVYSQRFGGSGGSRTDKVSIDCPSEQIKAINFTIANSILFGNFSGQDVITSLSFVTNVTEYGPFGSKLGTFISTFVENGYIVGFHGRAGEFINSIGFYTIPKVPCFCQILLPVKEEHASNLHQSINARELVEPRDPGPWGGPCGNNWDDGVFSAVQKVHLYIGHGSNGAVHAIQVEYMKRDGQIVWSPRHGGCGGELVEVDFTREILIGIEGSYGPVDGKNGSEVAIASMTLYTNSGTYGPFGGNGRGRSYFTSVHSPGKVVGFLGRGTYLNALGVHMEYF